MVVEVEGHDVVQYVAWNTSWQKDGQIFIDKFRMCEDLGHGCAFEDRDDLPATGASHASGSTK